jgi:hypothetical protein
MPRDVPTFTTCAGPGTARSHKQLGLSAPLVAQLVDVWESGGPVFGSISAALIFLTEVVVTVGIIVITLGGGAGLAAGWVWALLIIANLETVKHWYYHERLLCVSDDDECLIGTVLSRPEIAFDGDRKLNLIPTPLIRDDHIVMLVTHLDANRDLLTAETSLPDFPPQGFNPASPLNSDLASLARYMDAVDQADQQLSIQMQVGTVARLMSDNNTSTFFPGEPKNYFNRFYRKDTAFIAQGSALWDAIPRDNDATVDWEQPNAHSDRKLNPMFRFESKDLAFYVHCELEGDRIRDLIDSLIIGIWAFMTTLTIVTLISGFGWGIVGGLIALIVAGLLSYFISGVLLGSAAEDPNIDWDDEDANQDGIPDQPGDLIVVRGPQIMDTEHENYFEVHPVRAYYLVARGDEDAPELVEPGQALRRFDPRLVSKERADNICAMIDPSEDDPADSVEITVSDALSFGMETPYSGGGFVAR